MLKSVVEALIQGPHWRGKTRLLKLLLHGLDGVPVRSHYGPFLRSRVRDFTNRAAMLGTYAVDYDDVFAEVGKLEPGMAFIDVGANAGLFSMAAGRKVGKSGVVIAFEPSLPIYRDLVENALSNGLENFFPFNAALGPRAAVARFSPETPEHSGGAHLDGSGEVQVVQLRFDDLEQLFRELVGSRRCFVKIDVEGAEELVLESMRRFLESGQVEKVIAEIDPKLSARFGGDPTRIYTKLQQLGFRPSRGLGAAAHYNEVFDRHHVLTPASERPREGERAPAMAEAVDEAPSFMLNTQAGSWRGGAECPEQAEARTPVAPTPS